MRFGVRTYLREIAARVAAIFDLLRGTEPRFLGTPVQARRRRADMRARFVALLLAFGLGGASAPGLAPFLPPAAAPKFLEVLTPPDFIDRAVIEAFEKDSGLTVALDTYASAAELAERSAERRYDLVVAQRAALARRSRRSAGSIAACSPNSQLVQPLVAAKYGAYDRDGALWRPVRLVGLRPALRRRQAARAADLLRAGARRGQGGAAASPIAASSGRTRACIAFWPRGG